MAKFVSRYISYRAVISQDLVAEFHDGVYETDDPRIIEALMKWGYPVVSVEEGMRVGPRQSGPEITDLTTTASHVATKRPRGRPRKVPVLVTQPPAA